MEVGTSHRVLRPLIRETFLRDYCLPLLVGFTGAKRKRLRALRGCRRFLLGLCVLFAGDDGLGGAYRSAGTAVDAGVGVDVVDFAFRDSFYGAVGQAGAAGYTLVGDYVSHDCLFIRKLYLFVDRKFLRLCKVSISFW